MNSHAPTVAAVCEFLAPAAIVVLNSVLPGSDAGSTITANEIVCAVMTSVVTYGAYARAMRLIATRGSELRAAGDVAEPGAPTQPHQG